MNVLRRSLFLYKNWLFDVSWTRFQNIMGITGDNERRLARFFQPRDFTGTRRAKSGKSLNAAFSTTPRQVMRRN